MKDSISRSVNQSGETHSELHFVQDASGFYARALQAATTEEAEKWYELYQKAAQQEILLMAQRNRVRNRVCLMLLLFSMTIFMAGAVGLSSLARDKVSAQNSSDEIHAIDDRLLMIGSVGMGAVLAVFVPDLLPFLLKALNTAKRLQINLKDEEVNSHD